MICPQCRDEFRDGVLRCPDCNVALTHSVPAPEPDHPNVVELLRTNDPSFLIVVKSLLESESIPCSVQGEEALGLTAILPFAPFGRAKNQGARVFVPQDRLEEARNLLEANESPEDP